MRTGTIYAVWHGYVHGTAALDTLSNGCRTFVCKLSRVTFIERGWWWVCRHVTPEATALTLTSVEERVCVTLALTTYSKKELLQLVMPSLDNIYMTSFQILTGLGAPC